MHLLDRSRRWKAAVGVNGAGAEFNLKGGGAGEELEGAVVVGVSGRGRSGDCRAHGSGNLGVRCFRCVKSFVGRVKGIAEATASHGFCARGLAAGGKGKAEDERGGGGAEAAEAGVEGF